MVDTVDVSVVLPIYNAEKYLDQALSSIEVNSRVSLEIICVNDGSTDSSLTIMLDDTTRLKQLIQKLTNVKGVKVVERL